MSDVYNAATESCYDGTTCLINKFNIKDEKELEKIESSITFAKLSLLEHEPIEGNFDFEYYKQIHYFVFCDLFEWAGQIRTIDLSKKKTSFVVAGDIDKLSNAIFDRIINEIISKELSFKEFVNEISDSYHSVNMLHPFREGNGRTQRIYFTLLVRHCGYDIDFK